MVVRLALTKEGYMQGIWEQGSQFSITGWEHYHYSSLENA